MGLGALRKGGTVTCWSDGSNDRLGDGRDDMKGSAKPVAVLGVTDLWAHSDVICAARGRGEGSVRS